MKTLRPGPKPDIKKDIEILLLHKKDGLSFRTISKKKRRDVSNVHIAYKRSVRLVGELSTLITI